jgi:hypothetical protein
MRFDNFIKVVKSALHFLPRSGYLFVELRLIFDIAPSGLPIYRLGSPDGAIYLVDDFLQIGSPYGALFVLVNTILPGTSPVNTASQKQKSRTFQRRPGQLID